MRVGKRHGRTIVEAIDGAVAHILHSHRRDFRAHDFPARREPTEDNTELRDVTGLFIVEASAVDSSDEVGH